MKNKTLVFVALAGGAVCLVCILACGGSVLLLWSMAAPPDQMTVTIDAPLRVAPDEEFTIHLEVVNGDSRPWGLETIQIDESYQDGIAVSGSAPAYEGSYLDAFNALYIYEYRTDIPAGGTWTADITAQALVAGDHVGTLYVCPPGLHACASQMVRTVVEPSASDGVIGGVIGGSALPQDWSGGKAQWEGGGD